MRYDVEEKDISRLFMSVIEDASQDTAAVRGVFDVLIKSTLNYRDHIQESKGIVLTVEDVRTVLDWLPPSLATERLPATDDRIRLDLLKLWLVELRSLGHS